jgi:hypothetical protein
VLAGSSKVEPGAVPAADVTLAWATFSDAADQAGISRRYGGIHFVQGDLQGRSGGRLVGAQVWAKALTYFNGTAAAPGAARRAAGAASSPSSARCTTAATATRCGG